MIFAAFVIMTFWQGRNDCISKASSGCYPVRDPFDLAILAASFAGACAGFLWWNAAPARIFMGDTGSLALGGALAGMAIMTHTELLLAVLGGLFVVITMSSLIQIGYYAWPRGQGHAPVEEGVEEPGVGGRVGAPGLVVVAGRLGADVEADERALHRHPDRQPGGVEGGLEAGSEAEGAQVPRTGLSAA